MVVNVSTLSPGVASDIIIDPIKTDIYYLGSSRNLKVDLKKGETAHLYIENIEPNEEDDPPMFSAKLDGAILESLPSERVREKPKIIGLSDNSTNQSLPPIDLNNQNSFFVTARVEDGKNRGSFTITSETAKEKLLSYNPKDRTSKEIPPLNSDSEGMTEKEKERENEDENKAGKDMKVNKLGAGAIAGIVIGCICILVIVIGVTFAARYYKINSQETSSEEPQV